MYDVVRNTTKNVAKTFISSIFVFPYVFQVLSEAYVNGYQDGVQYLQHHGLCSVYH